MTISLNAQVITLLRGPVTARIRFRFSTTDGRTITIAPQTFHRVARAIETGNARVERSANLRSGVAAQYDSASRNALQISPMLGRIEEGLVLHEALHAAYDLLHTNINAADEEASAYVVSSLYFRMTGVRPGRWNAILHANAGEAANSLLRQYARGTAGIPAVDGHAFAILRLLVMTDPVYMFPGSDTGDFTLGLATTLGSYTHDG